MAFSFEVESGSLLSVVIAVMLLIGVSYVAFQFFLFIRKLKKIEKEEMVILEKEEERGLSYTRFPSRRGDQYMLSSGYYKIILTSCRLIIQQKLFGKYSTLFCFSLTEKSHFTAPFDRYINLHDYDYRFTFFEDLNRLILEINIVSNKKYNFSYKTSFYDVTYSQVTKLKRHFIVFPPPYRFKKSQA